MGNDFPEVLQIGFGGIVANRNQLELGMGSVVEDSGTAPGTEKGLCASFGSSPCMGRVRIDRSPRWARVFVSSLG